VHRKVVTVLFCDVVGSTALGESVDPEALQGLLARYFERMNAIVERHGGSVEKFIGDAVMAVFGVPAVHEDDALRACRAAVQMRDAFPELRIEGRVGVNTGEVVTGTEERLATGDTVNVAARLQQAAAPNEVLIGAATLELVRNAVEVEPVEPLELKGKAEPVPSFRLVTVAEAPARSHETRFVGREREVDLIGAAWQRAVAEQRCELMTIVGDAGVGKSRLAAEALAGIDARVVRGRCLPYGEGITYWPVVEVLKQLDALPTAVLRLEPLAERAAEELVADLPVELRARITAAAGGNPLFLTEMLAMAAESEEVEVPPTLRALLAARLDQLDPADRAVLERGAVEGEVFHRGGVQTLVSDDEQVTPRLTTLVRRALIRPERAQLPGEDGFRFRHILIRDAAYDALPKATRAELHERFAGWLEQRGAELVELDEILGYHLEQAARYKRELGQSDPPLAERAGGNLAAAGRRALWRGDEGAAARLLERALELNRPRRLDVHLEVDLAEALFNVAPQRAAEIAEAAAERAHAAGDETGEALGRVAAARHRYTFADDPAYDEMENLARSALPLLEEVEDHAGLVHVWTALGVVAATRGQGEDGALAAEQALVHARLAGQHISTLLGLPNALIHGPRPADEALRTIDALLPENPDPGTLLWRAWLLAMLARFEEAAQIAREAGERCRQLAGHDGVEHMLGSIAVTVGDHEAAVGHLRRFCDWLEASGHRGELSTYAPALGRELCALGRHDEAEPLARLGRELGDEQDAATQATWQKNLAAVAQVRPQLEALRERMPA
jgi:class 3 adenylate cyclase/tetratricopeptide (TPR) repeat protein